MASNWLYVPLRITYPLDLGATLTEIIKQDYFQTPSIFQQDLASATNVRNAITSLKDEAVGPNAIVNLKKYHQLLTTMFRKFPDDEIEFSWSGSLGYSPTRPSASRSLKVEQLNVLYQLGSSYSQLAMAQSRHSDDGLKLSCSYLQQAAGYFDAIIQRITPALQLPPDFSTPTLQFLNLLMLAQAQESIWQKAIANPDMKDSVIAKLSAQTADYYAQAAAKANESESIRQGWINHTTAKSYHFKAAAHFRLSNVCLDAFKYGDQVAHLKLASKYCDLAGKYKRYVNDFVIDDLNGLTETIKSSLRVAEKDNDLVYLKMVPAESEMAPLAGVSMVKPTPPSSDLDEGLAVFEELIPFAIVQIAQAFRERLDTYINDTILTPIQALDKLMNTFLTERNLPASIDSIQKPEVLPESAIQHSKELISIGGNKTINASIQGLRKLAGVCVKILVECEERLKKDGEEDKYLRSQLGDSAWNRPTSESAEQHLLTRVDKLRYYISEAEKGDITIFQEFDQIRDLVNIYCGGYDELNKYIPTASFTDIEPSLNKIIVDLREMVSSAAELTVKRRNFFSRLELKVRDNNILPVILDKYKQNKANYHNEEGRIESRLFEPVYDQHLKVFQDDIKFVEVEKQKQIDLENKIGLLNNEFVLKHSQVHNESQVTRQQALQSLEQAYNTYLQLNSHVNDGMNFYSHLITNGNDVLRECEEFVQQRRIEGRELEMLLTRPSELQSPVQAQSAALRPNPQPQAPSSVVTPKPMKPGFWDPSQGIKFG